MPLIRPRAGSGFTTLYWRDRVTFLKELTRQQDIFRIRLLDKKPVVVTGPQVLHECLVERAADQRKDPLMRNALYPLLGEGLVTSDGALWRQQRRTMAPMFPPSQLASYAADMVTCTQQALDTWRDGQTLDMASETTRITMSIAGKILFDADMFSETDELGAALSLSLAWSGRQLNSIQPLIQLALRRSLARLSTRLPPMLAALAQRGVTRLEQPLLLLTEQDRRMQEAVALLDRRVQRLVEERRAGRSERRDLLGRLLVARGDGDAAMSNKQVRDEIVTLFVAGHETTAATLAFTLSLMVRHPEVYRQARAQVDALNGPPRPEDLPRLQLLLRCFKEALRLYPPLPMLVRETVRDMPLGGYLLPQGTTVLLSPYATQHRADLWPDPQRFDPDRFTPEAEAARPRLAFMAFSGGPRICLGNHLALLEGPLVLATLLRHADFELADDTPLCPHVREALRPRGGVPMRVRLRQPPA